MEIQPTGSCQQHQLPFIHINTNQFPKQLPTSIYLHSSLTISPRTPFKDSSSLVNQLWITRSGVSSQPLSKLLRNQETLPSLSLPLGWDLDQSPPFHRHPFNHLTISVLLCIILIVVSLSNASSCNYREMKDKRDHQWSRLLDMLSRINYIRPPLTT